MTTIVPWKFSGLDLSGEKAWFLYDSVILVTSDSLSSILHKINCICRALVFINFPFERSDTLCWQFILQYVHWWKERKRIESDTCGQKLKQHRNCTSLFTFSLTFIVRQGIFAMNQTSLAWQNTSELRQPLFWCCFPSGFAVRNNGHKSFNANCVVCHWFYFT